MTIKEVMRYFGNSHQFQIATGMSHTNFINWRKRGYIPLKSQRRIEKMTNGVLRVRYEDLGDL